MIVRPRPGFLKLFFLLRGSVVPCILPQIIGFVIYASAIVVIVEALGLDLTAFSIGPFGLIGVTQSIFLGFLNNDLALDGLCRVCEISVLEALGETSPPMLASERLYHS